MNPKNKDTDSGSYVNGVYTTKNGYSGSGLNCPRGTRLYDSSKIKKPIFFFPKDTPPGELFRPITREVAPDILDYYAVSNYGRVMNINSGKVMKENFRPNGYGYFCLAADNCKNGQKKYSTHRLVMKTFKPCDDMDNLEVNHKDGDKSHNYVDKVMPDGTIESNLEWSSHKENAEHRQTLENYDVDKITTEMAKNIRDLHDEGYSYELISKKFYPYLSTTGIQNVCCNRAHYDPNYERPELDIYNNSKSDYFKITDKDAERIRKLHEEGYNNAEIQRKFYPEASVSSVGNVILRKTHNR